MRNKMDLKFYCSIHPENQLTFSSDLSRVGGNSAYEINVKIVIHPCGKCLQEIERIEKAIDVLLNFKKGR